MLISFWKSYKSNALIRNSTHGPEHRELLGAEKQWKEIVELAFEQLPEIFKSRCRRCPPLYGEDIRMTVHSVSRECMTLFINKSGTA